MTMTTRDPLLDGLRRLPRAALDDLRAARTFASAEAAFATRDVPAQRPRRSWLAPTALGLWGVLYLWGSVRELQRIFPGDSHDRGPSPVARTAHAARRLTLSSPVVDDSGVQLLAARPRALPRRPTR